MVKTTVYLDAEIALALRQLSRQEACSQAELIRDAISQFVQGRKRPATPGVGEFDSGESGVSARAEEILREASVQEVAETEVGGSAARGLGWDAA
jgi:predicted transcriptional regulator